MCGVWLLLYGLFGFDEDVFGVGWLYDGLYVGVVGGLVDEYDVYVFYWVWWYVFEYGLDYVGYFVWGRWIEG